LSETPFTEEPALPATGGGQLPQHPVDSGVLPGTLGGLRPPAINIALFALTAASAFLAGAFLGDTQLPPPTGPMAEVARFVVEYDGADDTRWGRAVRAWVRDELAPRFRGEAGRP